MAAGIGSALGGKLAPLAGDGAQFTAGNIASHVAVRGASLLASAATRSAISGTNFERNITAGLPDVLAQTLVDVATGAAGNRNTGAAKSDGGGGIATANGPASGASNSADIVVNDQAVFRALGYDANGLSAERLTLFVHGAVNRKAAELGLTDVFDGRPFQAESGSGSVQLDRLGASGSYPGGDPIVAGASQLAAWASRYGLDRDVLLGYVDSVAAKFGWSDLSREQLVAVGTAMGRDASAEAYGQRANLARDPHALQLADAVLPTLAAHHKYGIVYEAARGEVAKGLAGFRDIASQVDREIGGFVKFSSEVAIAPIGAFSFGHDIVTGNVTAVDLASAGVGGAIVIAASRGKLRPVAAESALPGAWRTVNESMSARSLAYQTQITGRSGEAFVANGVRFDGFEAATFLEAKGPGYATFVKNGEFRSWFRGQDALVSQAQRQLTAANGAPVTWHVAEAKAADAMRSLFATNKVKGINVIHTPVGP